MKVNVIIATHKKYEMPKYKSYLPVHVGKEGKDDIGFKGDNTGNNISKKNPYFCELTGIYWAWKNLKADYVGLAHYRRHFKGNTKSKNSDTRKETTLNIHKNIKKIRTNFFMTHTTTY